MKKMPTVIEYILQREENQKEIFFYFHDLFINELYLNAKIRYKIPFYDGYGRICYLNPLKGGKIELAFIHGKRLSNEQGLLQAKNRKQIAGIELHKLSTIPFDAVHEIIQEAIDLDKQMARQPKR